MSRVHSEATCNKEERRRRSWATMMRYLARPSLRTDHALYTAPTNVPSLQCVEISIHALTPPFSHPPPHTHTGQTTRLLERSDHQHAASPPRQPPHNNKKNTAEMSRPAVSAASSACRGCSAGHGRPSVRPTYQQLPLVKPTTSRPHTP